MAGLTGGRLDPGGVRRAIFHTHILTGKPSRSKDPGLLLALPPGFSDLPTAMNCSGCWRFPSISTLIKNSRFLNVFSFRLYSESSKQNVRIQNGQNSLFQYILFMSVTHNILFFPSLPSCLPHFQKNPV